MTTGIYMIYSPDGGSYIGSAIDIERRWVDHRRDLKNGTHHSPKLQAAWNRHEGKLSFEIMCECAESELLALEQKKINEYMPEFNMCLVAARSSDFNAGERSRLVSEAESLLRSNSRDAREIIKARERECGFKSALETAQKNIRYEDAIALEARILAKTTDGVVISTRETRLASSTKLRELYDEECERIAFEKRQREHEEADKRIAAEAAERDKARKQAEAETLRSEQAEAIRKTKEAARIKRIGNLKLLPQRILISFAAGIGGLLLFGAFLTGDILGMITEFPVTVYAHAHKDGAAGLLFPILLFSAVAYMGIYHRD